MSDSCLRVWVAAMVILLWTVQTHAFSFADAEDEERAQESARHQAAERRIRRQLNTACPRNVKNSRIMVAVMEIHNGRSALVHGSHYQGLFSSINSKLRDQGFRTYTPEEIRRQIAAAEQRAYLNNDLDAAVDAANRLGADYVLKTSISTVTQKNSILRINEVFLNMGFELQDRRGRGISHASARADSFAGADTVAVAEDLVRARARSVVAKLYHDLCRHGKGR